MVEPSVDLVCKELENVGAECLIVNFEEIGMRFSLEWSSDSTDQQFRIFDLSSDFAGKFFHSVWFRQWGYPALPVSFSETDKAFCFGEFTSFLHGFCSRSKIKQVNDIANERLFSNKIRQLQIASHCGMRIPETCVTNNPSIAKDFLSRYQDVIFKPLSAGIYSQRTFSKSSEEAINEKYSDRMLEAKSTAAVEVIYTQLLTKQHLESLSSLKFSPTIFQKLVRKAYDVRTTIVGKQIISCKIESQKDSRTEIDFRHLDVIGNLPHYIIETPGHVEKFISVFMEECGLIFGCMDFVVDLATGEWIFLENNPSGQWLWVEQLTGVPISKYVAAELCNTLS